MLKNNQHNLIVDNKKIKFSTFSFLPFMFLCMTNRLVLASYRRLLVNSTMCVSRAVMPRVSRRTISGIHLVQPSQKVATLDYIFFSPAAMLFSVISAFLVPIIPKLCLKFIIIHF